MMSTLGPGLKWHEELDREDLLLDLRMTSIASVITVVVTSVRRATEASEI